MKHIILALIKFYKLAVSPFTTAVFGNACRYNPTCSEYTYQAVTKYGAFKGLGMGLKRLSTCHPFYHKSGYDPLT
jgi:putative membrane protein insertion efficiency factor